MRVERFKSFDEARLALLRRPPDAQLADRIRSLWRFATRAVPREPPRGVMRFASIEDTNRARDVWVKSRAVLRCAPRGRARPTGGYMKQLAGFHKTYLRGLAHALRPAVRIGKEGLTPEVLAAVNDAVGARELVKVAIPGERTERRDVAAAIAAQIGAECLGVVGGVAIFYRPQDDPEKRRITLPARRGVDRVS